MEFCLKKFYLPIRTKMNKSLLITRPDHDSTTRYLSCWSEKIIHSAREKGIRVIDLHRKRANKSETINILKKRNPSLVVLNGHGSDDQIKGYDDEVILDGSNRSVLNSKIVYARSCRSAKILGQSSISHGTLTFLGYKEDFIFMYEPAKISKPLADKTAALFLEPSNYVPISLLKGHNTEDANKRSKNFFRKNIEKLLVSGPSSENYDSIRFLLWDMRNQVCLGNREVTL